MMQPNAPTAQQHSRRPGGLVRWHFLLPIVALLIAVCLAANAVEERWVTTWGCATQLTEPHNLPPVPLAERALRQFVRVSLGGNEVRVRLSNAFGTNAVVVRAANIALAEIPRHVAAGRRRSRTEAEVSRHARCALAPPKARV